MSKYITQQISGYCPKQNKNYTVDVSYGNIPLPHLISGSFVRVNFLCNYHQDFNCEYHDNCPIVNSSSLTL